MFSVVVHTGEHAVEYHQGRRLRILMPGKHRRRFRARYVRVDVRSRMTALAPQEVLTADGVSVRVTAVIHWQAQDAGLFIEAAQDPVAPVYLAVQVALRDAMSGLAVADAVRLAHQDGLGDLAATASRVAEGVGIAVSRVTVKDVLLPAELKAAYAELVAARQRGQAQLEQARAETASLRSLANGAALLDQHPALARLRMVQALPPGAQLVLRMGRDEEAQT